MFPLLFQLSMVLSPVGMTMAMAVAVGSSLAEVATMGTTTSGSGMVRITATTITEITQGTTIQGQAVVAEDRKGTATLRTTATTRTATATTRTATATLGMATNSDAPTSTTTTGTGGLSATMARGNKALHQPRRLFFILQSME